MEAFTIVRSLPYGDEMFTIAEILTILHETRETETITLVAELQLPNCPQQSLLRPETWKAIESLRRAIEDIRAVVRSVSLATRSLALNRAQGKLVKVLDIKALPEVERELILEIVQSWLNLLVNLAGSVGAVETTQPVRNPYVIGDPVEGRLFVGREDILRELEELWIHNQHLQSVVLYGHRRMGKTSILRNIATHSGSEVRVIYVNLQGLSSIARGVGEVFLAICDEIADALNLPRPDDAELLELPQRTFERYLKQVLKQIDKKGLIIALDEFETLEALIEAGQIPADFMGFLRSLVQMSPQLAFAFAGLHTLEEMTADYFQPFFASVIPIRVGFLKPAATRQLLVNPSEDFPLDYTPEARDRVQSLTAGQPFLVQLVGFQLVRRYNDRVFEEGRKQNPCFEVEDVDAAINPEFFQRGRYYFEGVWKAAQDAAGQQAILQVLAPHPEGLREEDLRSALGVEVEDWERTLQDLQRHDVIEKRGGRWRIAIELFRRWVRRSLEI
ncbi:MAG: AAA family ATPase [Cyanobacteriota bacterium]|nr:AAA family ATPase [Cyanobacteriota bacterium]